MKNKIIFSGYYGEKNTGDDAFCSIMSWIAHNHLSSCPIFMTDNLPVLPYPAKCLFSSNQSFKGQNKLRLFSALASVRRLVFAGGSIFHGHEGWERRYTEYLSSVVPLSMGAVGVSVGPFKSVSDEDRVAKFLRKLSFLVLRDRLSFEIACSMDLPYQPTHGFDLAGLLPLVYPHVPIKAANTNADILGIIPCCHPYGKSLSLAELSVEDKSLLEALLIIEQTSNFRFRFFTFNGGGRFGDGNIVKLIASKIVDQSRVEIIPYCSDPGFVYSMIAECQSVLAVRLHGAIFALMAGVPFCLGEYHRKCSDFLDEIEVPECYRIGNFDVPSKDIANLILSSSFCNAYVFRNLDHWVDRARVNISKL